MSRQGELDLDALFDLEPSSAVEPTVPLAPAAAQDLVVNGLSVWGAIARVVEVRPGVAWVDASSWSGYVLDEDAQRSMPTSIGARLGRAEEIEGGWWREGAAAGIVAGTWPQECVQALATSDRLTAARAAEQLRRDVVAGARTMGLHGRAIQEVVARWDRATVTDVEEVPDDTERRPGTVDPERGGRAGTQREAEPGERADRAGVVAPEGPVEAARAGDGGGPRAAGDPSEPAGSDLVDLPAGGQEQLPERFWTLLDRLWGVLQADEAPTRILIEDVTWPATDPTHSPRVRFAESDLAWGAKLLAMMIEVRDELTRQPATPDLSEVNKAISRLQSQLEALEAQTAQ